VRPLPPLQHTFPGFRCAIYPQSPFNSAVADPDPKNRAIDGEFEVDLEIHVLAESYLLFWA
jgi:hypothetical protein